MAEHPRRRGAGRRVPPGHPRPRARTRRLLARRSPSSRGSPTTSSPSWRCRCTSRSSRSTRGCSRRRRTCTRSSTQAFLRVTLPLSAPGIVAGTLLTFIPAAGDFINAALLGTPKQPMIGNVIQAKFLDVARLPDGGVALVHPHGADPRRAARLRPHRRHGEADRMTTVAADRPPRVRARGSRARTWRVREAPRADRLRAARRRLPDAPDRGRDPVLVQRAEGRFNYVWQGFTLDNWINWDAVLGHPDASSRRSRSGCSRRSSRPRSGR